MYTSAWSRGPLCWDFFEKTPGENAVRVDKRLLIIGARFFGEELLADVGTSTRDEIGRQALQRFGFSLSNANKEQIMSFEQFLRAPDTSCSVRDSGWNS